MSVATALVVPLSAKQTTGADPADVSNDVALRGLLGMALALAPKATLTTAELALARQITPSTDLHQIETLVAKIRQGEDPLGKAYCQIRNSVSRRSAGQTFTPPDAIRTMLNWAASMKRNVVRIVDPGAGTGRYTIAALNQFPRAKAVAVEMDPVVAILLRANLAACELSHRCKVIVDDYRKILLESISGRTLFIGNPPYVRHHLIPVSWKQWYSTALKQFQVSGSQLAGLHLHFFVKTCQLAQSGDLGCFITAAEWLDAGYGSALRGLLTSVLGGVAVSVARPDVQLFDDAMVSASIAAFLPGVVPERIRFSDFSQLKQTNVLTTGHSVLVSEARAQTSWSALVQRRTTISPINQIELGEVFRISRGQITGQNSVWILRRETPLVPQRFLVPTITKASDIIHAPSGVISREQELKRVISLPSDLSRLPVDEFEQVNEFLKWARENGADKTYTAKHRTPWYSVRFASPSPAVVMTYMGRRPPVFARNKIGVPLLNIALGLYPRYALSVREMVALINWLNANVRAEDGRMYAGGLAKFEPSVAMKIRIPAKLLGQ